MGDEEIEGHHTFNLEEKVLSEKFDVNFVKNMEGIGKNFKKMFNFFCYFYRFIDSFILLKFNKENKQCIFYQC